jgi:glycerol-3-phosphate cytidylyltransferase-like family protein
MVMRLDVVYNLRYVDFVVPSSKWMLATLATFHVAYIV